MNPTVDTLTGTARAGGAADLVRGAFDATDEKRRSGAFSLNDVGGMRWMAPVIGVYLAYVVARVPEVFPALTIPRFPMVSLLVFTTLLVVAVPGNGWRQMWKASFALRGVGYLFALAWITIPIGIWMSGAFHSVTERYSISVVTFLTCLVFLRDRQALRAAIRVFVLFVLSLAIYGILNFDPEAMRLAMAEELGIDPANIPVGRLRLTLSTSLDPNDWGAVLVVTIPLAMWLASTAKAWKPFWYLVAIALVGGVVPTQSRGALLGLLAVGLVVIGFGAKGWKRLALVPIIVVAGVVFVKIGGQGGLGRITSFSSDDYNLTNNGRWYFWRQGFVWMIKRPWGHGMENYGTFFGWMNDGRERAAHSSWIQYGVELGLLGLSLFVGLVVTLARNLAGYRRRMLGVSIIEARTAGLFLAMLAGMLVTGSFISYAYYPLMYMVLAFSAVVLLGNPWQPVGTELQLTRVTNEGRNDAAPAPRDRSGRPIRIQRPAARR